MESRAEGTETSWTLQYRAHAALVAGCLWLVLWAHQMLTHGTTQVNERRLALGLTWMDSGKVFVLCFLLLMVTMVGLQTGDGQSGRVGRSGFVVVVLALVFLAIGTALQFWSFPIGSYARTFEEAGGFVEVGGPLQALGSLFLAAAMVPFGMGLARREIVPVWIVPVLVVGAATTVFLTPAFPLPGVAWIALGVTVHRR